MKLAVRTEHAAQRAEERYGIVATDEEWMQALLDILDTVAGDRKAALRLANDKRRKSERWLVKLAGVQIVACYLPEAALIVSVWPAGLNKDRGRQNQSTCREWGRGRTARVREEVWE